MTDSLSSRERLLLWLAGASAALTVVSIAAFETLLGLALVALILDRKQFRWPPVILPLSLWFVGTLVSAAASGHAGAALPQVKKFYVYLLLFVVYAAFREIQQILWLIVAWTMGATLSSLWSLLQFAHKIQGARAGHQNFYLYYVGARITGFMGHWMTFSGHMMIVLLLLASLVFWGRDWMKARAWTLPVLLLCAVIITLGLLAAFTRSMWLGALVGSVYLVWMWQKRLVLAIPVILGLVLAANPFALRDRAISAFQPHGDTDSNEHREITREVGYRMIKAHPWFGVGPEEVGPQFKQYLPADAPSPLPTGFYGHLHNIYIHYAAERGVPTMLALMWMIAQSLFDFTQALRRSSQQTEGRWILHAAIAVTLAVCVSGFYELNLGDSEVLGLYLAVMACGYTAAGIVGAAETQNPVT